MKRFTLSLLALLALTVGVAVASGGADIYNSKCAMCHGADGTKTSSASGDAMLKGQSAEDIEAKLKGYADGSSGGPKKKIMSRIAQKLSAEEITAVAAHVGSL